MGLESSTYYVLLMSCKVMPMMHGSLEELFHLGYVESICLCLSHKFWSLLNFFFMDPFMFVWWGGFGFAQIQEYVEAATVLEFCKSGKLLTLADLNNEISKLGNSSTSQFKINILDYLLGVSTRYLCSCI